MNILLISDDGPDSVGLEILQESARSHWGANAKIITIVPKESTSGRSFSVTPALKNTAQPYVKFVEREARFYVVDGTPLDCLYLGMLYPTHVLGTDSFDVVLTGVNMGHNVGADVFHSGTVAVAMLAASLFGVASVAFSQEIDSCKEGDFDLMNSREVFGVAEVFTRKVLTTHPFTPGSCLNVNFPKASPKGYKKVPPAPFSRWLPSKTSRDTNNDIAAVAEGFIAISELELSVAPSMSY